MNVTEIARRVRNTFGDTAGVLITDQMLYDWINDASKDIAQKNGLLQVKSTSPTIIGTSAYSVPDNLLTLHSVLFNNQKLTPYSQAKADDLGLTDPTNSTGVPLGFSLYGDAITLYPTPSSVGTLLIVYTRQPFEVTTLVDIPEVAIQYHNRIVEYCLSQAAEVDDDTVKADRKMQQFNQGVADLLDNAEGDAEDYYPSFGVPLADSSGWSYREDC